MIFQLSFNQRQRDTTNAMMNGLDVDRDGQRLLQTLPSLLLMLLRSTMRMNHKRTQKKEISTKNIYLMYHILTKKKRKRAIKSSSSLSWEPHSKLFHSKRISQDTSQNRFSSSHILTLNHSIESSIFEWASFFVVIQKKLFLIEHKRCLFYTIFIKCSYKFLKSH